MSYAIKAENLGKMYWIGHQSDKAAYSTLRESLTQLAGNLYQRIRHPMNTSGNQSMEEFWALRDVNFEIQPGDRVGIIGRNGAGKSTLLKILSRITEPTTGRFTTRGRVASLLEVGTGFHPELTGRENIYLNGAILGMSRADVKRQFDAIVNFSGVEKFLDTPVKRYSSGMYVRLAFSVAAHLEPDILIVDEVLAVGDAEFQKKCLGKMEDVGKEGRTVVFVSHNMGAVRRLCNTCFVLQNGHTVFSGSVSDSATHYMRQGTQNGQHLQAVETRAGSGGAHIIDISIINSNGQFISQVNNQQEFTIKVDFEVDQNLTDHPVEVGIAFDSILGKRLFTTTTEWAKFHIQTGLSRVLYCKFDSLPLQAGPILISLTLMRNNVCLELAEHCFTLDIIPNSESIIVPEGNFGFLAIPHRYL